MKEKEDLENMVNSCNEQIKEEENKNKNFTSLIEEQKIEINELQEKLKLLNKNVETKRKIFEKKDEQNKDFIKKIKNQKIEYTKK